MGKNVIKLLLALLLVASAWTFMFGGLYLLAIYMLGPIGV